MIEDQLAQQLPSHPPLPMSPLQKLGNAVNMFAMAVANDDKKLMTATKKHLLDIVHAVHPDHEVPSPIAQVK